MHPANNGQDAELLRNDGGNLANALIVGLRGTGNNKEAIGARIRLTSGSRTEIRVSANQIITNKEGRGIVAHQPFAR